MSNVFGHGGGGGHGGGHGGHGHGGGGRGFGWGGYLVDYVPYYVDMDDDAQFEDERHLVIGAPFITDFSNEKMYLKGAVVRHLGGLWKANRTVDIPLLPFMMSGEVPGSSDAWTALAPVTVSGDAPDAFDIAAETQKMNSLKQVPVSVAQVLLRNGQGAINHAMQSAKANNLPNQNTLSTNYYKLAWHQSELAKYAATPFALYPSADDLKKWVLEAFINSNATDVGAAWINDGLQKMWSEIRTAIAALPAAARAAVSSAIENITGVPTWAFAVGGVAVVSLVGYAVYKIAMGPTGQAAASAYLGRR